MDRIEKGVEIWKTLRVSAQLTPLYAAIKTSGFLFGTVAQQSGARHYLGSQRHDESGVFFMCLHKDDIYQVQLPELVPGVTYTDNDFRCCNQLEAYHNNEMEFLHKIFSLLRVFKKGNIGFKEIFMEHRFSALGGFMNNTQNQTSDNVTRNVTERTIFTMMPEEAIRCNQFLQEYLGQEHTLLKSCIDEFVWGLEQVDLPTGFEQYTTALEMIFLQKNQQGKKEVLSKRVAVLLESDPANVRVLYYKMKDYYRYRSDSLHEGDGRNISDTELKELEEIVRDVLLIYLRLCKAAILNNPSVTWGAVKDNKINVLKAAVQAAITAGTLPAQICSLERKKQKLTADSHVVVSYRTTGRF